MERIGKTKLPTLASSFVSSRTEIKDDDEQTTEKADLDFKLGISDATSSKPTMITELAQNVVASHYNNLQEHGMAGRFKSKIFFMRNFNNWIKSVLIEEYLIKTKEKLKLGAPLKVLDLCSGKGGDLLKWQKGCITHLICTDIAEISVSQCKERYESMRSKFDAQNKFSKMFTADFITCDATRGRLREKYKDPTIELNLVSCQFAFHYSFESICQAECMLRNAAECLKTGGFFIGTMPDANEIMRRQREAKSKTFGNGIYKIEFQCDPDYPPLFGAKYHFKLDDVVDCPEFVVHFPTLVKLAKKYGLELVRKERFDDYYKQSIINGKFLLEKMKALETYPDTENSKFSDFEYEHVKKYSNQGHGSKKVGTLSKTEWEVSSLYLIFVFTKIKTTWNAEGKPEYVK